jgi:hypothetical protein
MTNRILLTYQNVSDPGLRAMAQHIVYRMTNNQYYPHPTPSLDHLRTEIERFQKMLMNTQIGRKAEYEKNKQSDYLRELLHELAAYVTREAKEDRIKLLSSGFDISKEREGRRSRSIKIETGKVRGEVSIIMRSVPGARVYIHQYSLGSPAKESDWHEVMSTSRKHVFKGLIPGKEYFFRSKAICLGNKEVISAVVIKIVQ